MLIILGFSMLLAGFWFGIERQPESDTLGHTLTAISIYGGSIVIVTGIILDISEKLK